MACQDCFNGCLNKTTDQCIIYTGENIPELGIEKGFPLLYVEQALINYLKKALNGTGIYPQIDADICEAVSKHLPNCSECDGITLNDILVALIKALCELNTAIINVQNQVVALNAPFDLKCIPIPQDPYTLHNVVQAIINRVCAMNLQLISLSTNLAANYVSVSNIDSYIAAYLTSQGASTLIKNKMVPYVAMEYYGPLSYFDSSGAGIGDWVDIYLCNGNNGTPDRRGRVAVGATTGMGGGAMSSIVDPAVSGNPNYSLLSLFGNNTVTLTTNQIPAHNHSATFVGAPHSHPLTAPYYTRQSGGGVNNALSITGNTEAAAINVTGFSVAEGTVTVNNAGGSEGHSNIQPSIGCYYIIYLP